MPRDSSGRGAQIDQDLKHEKHEWAIERVGWGVMGLLLLAALAGLLGTGPLSEAREGAPASALWVEYNRFERYQAPTKIVVHLRPMASEARLWVNYGFIRKVDLTHIDPEPERVEAGPDRYIFPFTLVRTPEDIIVTFYFKANEFGMMYPEVGLENGPSLRFWQLVYP